MKLLGALSMLLLLSSTASPDVVDEPKRNDESKQNFVDGVVTEDIRVAVEREMSKARGGESSVNITELGRRIQQEDVFYGAQIIDKKDLQPFPLWQEHQDTTFKSSPDLAQAQTKIEGEVARLAGEELINYLNGLRELEVSAAVNTEDQNKAQFKWAYASLIANFSGKVEHYYKKIRPEDYFYEAAFLKAPADLVLNWQDINNLEEAELFLHYSSYFFAGWEPALKFGLNLVRQDRDNALLCRSCAWILAGLPDKTTQWTPQLEYFARVVEKSDIKDSAFWAAFIYISLRYAVATEEEKRAAILKADELFRQTLRESQDSIIIERTQFQLKVTESQLRKLSHEN